MENFKKVSKKKSHSLWLGNSHLNQKKIKKMAKRLSMKKSARAARKMKRHSGKPLKRSPLKKAKCAKRTIKAVKRIAKAVGVSTAGTKSRICGRIASKGNLKDVSNAFPNRKSMSKRRSGKKSGRKSAKKSGRKSAKKSHKKSAKKSHKKSAKKSGRKHKKSGRKSMKH